MAASQKDIKGEIFAAQNAAELRMAAFQKAADLRMATSLKENMDDYYCIIELNNYKLVALLLAVGTWLFAVFDCISGEVIFPWEKTHREPCKWIKSGQPSYEQLLSYQVPNITLSGNLFYC